MKGSLVNTLLCFVGLNAPSSCITQSTWKNRKFTHLQSTLTNNKFISTNADLRYFAQELRNERNFVENLDKILIPRTIGSENHNTVRKHIARSMKKLGWSVEELGFNDRTPHGEKRFTNIVATLDADAPRRLVFACHYDSLLVPEGFLGAIDSAVPCAQMINLAHTLKEDLKLRKAEKSELTLQFLFLDGEEAFVKWGPQDSIYGARNLAAKFESDRFTRDGVTGNHNDRMDMFVLLDLIGTSDTGFFKLETSTGDWYDRLVDIEDSLRNINVVRGNRLFKERYINAGIQDDHLPFKRRDVPILHLISTPFPTVWHKISDNRENLDFERIGQLNKILRVFVAEYLHLLP